MTMPEFCNEDCVPQLTSKAKLGFFKNRNKCSNLLSLLECGAKQP